MIKLKQSVFLLFFIALYCGITLAACNAQQPVPTSEGLADPTPTPIPLPSPEVGKATVSGRVILNSTGEPFSNVVVRLARVIREGGEGAFVLEDAFSPGDVTDEEGYFVISNVDPIEYVIIVGDVNLEYDIISESSGKAKVWVTIEDEILEVGELNVDFP